MAMVRAEGKGGIVEYLLEYIADFLSKSSLISLIELRMTMLVPQTLMLRISLSMWEQVKGRSSYRARTYPRTILLGPFRIC